MVSTLVPIPPSPQEVAARVATKMCFAYESLLSKGEYLADSDALDRVMWERVGSGHRLVLKPIRGQTPFLDAEENDTATDGSISSSHTDDNAPSNVADNDNVSPSPTEPSPPMADGPADQPDPPKDLATLAIVVQLVPGANWLYPDARWTRGNKFTPSFSDAKLLCTGGAPQHPQFSSDFGVSIGNLNDIMSQIGDERNKRSTIITDEPGPYVKVRHSLFTVRSRFNAGLSSLSDPPSISPTKTQKRQIKMVCSSMLVVMVPLLTGLQI